MDQSCLDIILIVLLLWDLLVAHWNEKRIQYIEQYLNEKFLKE